MPPSERADYEEIDALVLLHPRRRIPILICFWWAEEAMESDLHLFFDESTEDFVEINSINAIGSGFVTMPEKLKLQHN